MPRRPCPTPSPLPAALLDRLAGDIARAHAGDAHATLVRARPGDRGVAVGLYPLPEGVHPAEALLGQVVTARWAAAGVVAPARARSLARPDDPGGPTTIVVLVGRDGHVASAATDPDAPHDPDAPDDPDAASASRAPRAEEPSGSPGAEAPVGRIPDLLRRTLGLPTPPTTVSAAEWWRACWLDALVSAAAVDPSRRPDPTRPLTSTLPEDLVRALVDEPELCDVEGWGRIRALAALPEPPPEPGPAAVRASVTPFVEPGVAAWLDDGSFARWLLDALPAVDELLDLAAALVPAEMLDLLHQVAGREGEAAPQGARGGDDASR